MTTGRSVLFSSGFLDTYRNLKTFYHNTETVEKGRVRRRSFIHFSLLFSSFSASFLSSGSFCPAQNRIKRGIKVGASEKEQSFLTQRTSDTATRLPAKSRVGEWQTRTKNKILYAVNSLDVKVCLHWLLFSSAFVITFSLKTCLFSFSPRPVVELKITWHIVTASSNGSKQSVHQVVMRCDVATAW